MIRLAALLLVFGSLLTGCTPTGDASGWELVPDRTGKSKMEVFPGIPVVLPATPPAPPFDGETGDAYSVFRGRLDQGSLFRRGYSAPTP